MQELKNDESNCTVKNSSCHKRANDVLWQLVLHVVSLSSNRQHYEIDDCLKDNREDYYLRQGGYVFARVCLSVC